MLRTGFRPVVLLDTNVVVEAVVPTSPSKAECAGVLEDLRDAGTLVLFSDLLEVELSQALFVAALRERHPRKRIKDIAVDDRIRPRAARLLRQGRASWEELLSTMTFARVAVGEVVAEVPQIMGRFGLESYDAVHAASAMRTGVADLVSLDNGFAKVPPSDLVLHTTQARLRQTRERRRRAGH